MQYPTFLVVALFSILNLPTHGQDSSDIDKLTHLEAVWNDAHRQQDPEAMDRIWDNDLQVFVPSMEPISKQTALAMIRSDRMKFERYESSDPKVRVYRDAAVVTGRIARTRRIGEKVVNDDWRFTKVYVRKSGQWRVVVFHASPA